MNFCIICVIFQLRKGEHYEERKHCNKCQGTKSKAFPAFGHKDEECDSAKWYSHCCPGAGDTHAVDGTNGNDGEINFHPSLSYVERGYAESGDSHCRVNPEVCSIGETREISDSRPDKMCTVAS